jgi:hypothetical protein
MKISFCGLISGRGTAEERTLELEDMPTEMSPKVKAKRKKRIAKDYRKL